MKRFVALYAAIDQTTKTTRKVAALADYFTAAPDDDKLWTIALFSGRRPRRAISFNVEFAVDSAQLTGAARRNLDLLGDALQSHGLQDMRFELSGHTDDTGSAAYNLHLSRMRAQAAKDYLVEHWRIAESRLEARGYGSSRPLDPRPSPEGRARNRRIEVDVLSPKTP